VTSKPIADDFKRLFHHDPDGFAALLALPPSERVTSLATTSAPIVVADGKKLHSSRDPLLEARRFARRQDVSRASVIVLMGYGSGHVARALLRQSRAPVFCFEPDLEVLREGLAHGPIEPMCQIITHPDRLADVLYRQLGAGDQGRIVTWVPSMRQSPELYHLAMQRTNQAVERARCRDMTTQVRVEGWLDFYLSNVINLAKGPGLARLRGRLSGHTAIVCSAGPSLTKNAALLKNVRDQALIFSVNTAARALAKIGVVPHAIVSVESLDVSTQLQEIPWISQVYAFLELTGNPALFRLPFRGISPLSVDTSSCSRFTNRVEPGSSFSAGFCVANAATALAQQLGCKRIILIGQDLAYSENRVYAEGTVFEDLRTERKDGKSVHVNLEAKHAIEANSKGSLIRGVTQSATYRAEEVEGWGGGSTVATNQDFLHFRDWFVRAAPKLNEHGVELINATEGGATIPGWREITLAQAIAEFGLDTPVDTTHPTASADFERVMAIPGIDAGVIIAEIVRERDTILTLMRLALEARALVNDDPDGDLQAQDGIAQRLADLTAATLLYMRDAPLVREALTRPVQALQERQELSILALAQVIESYAATLDARLNAIEDDMRALAAAAEPRASSQAA
jgi:uncharacterized Rossmann fold enzyme